MISVLSGLFAGVVHVVSGPDHLAAVAPLATERASARWRLGLRWGIGHASGVVLVGFLSLILRDILPLQSFSSWAERLVGVVLIGVGLWGMRKALSNHVHTHVHTHDGEPHAHVHVHIPRRIRTHLHTHAAFLIGILHGVAGGSHFLAVLPALAFPTLLEGATYLTCYAIGTVVSMVLFSGLVGLVANQCSRLGGAFHKVCMLGFSGAAILVGVVWIGS